MTQHTPTPWEIGSCDKALILSGEDKVAKVGGAFSRYDADCANAAHIVKCVNEYDQLKVKAELYDELVTATRWFMEHRNCSRACEDVKELLNKAEAL